MTKLKLTAAVSGLALMASAATAAPVVYTAYDVGANSLAAAPLSQAAAAAFDAAVGSFSVTDFETAPTELTAAGGSLTNTPDCGFALCGGNTTTGGEFFYRTSGTATFTFNSPTDAFGAYFSGWQLGTQTVTYSNGDIVVLDMPDGQINPGGMIFFGFIDDGASIASVSISMFGDIVAIDDVRLGADIPVPASLPLLLAGIGGLAVLRRRKTS